MAISNNDLVKFGYGLAENASKTAGHISFATDTRQLFVGDGENAVAFAGNVANAVFADKKLTITYNNGAAAAVLDFSDVASAEGVSSLLGGLRKDVIANATAISNLATAVDTSIKALDASYKAADALLDERIVALEGLVGEGGDVDERIAAAVEAEAELRALADSSIRTDFALADASIRTDFALADSSIRNDVSAYQTTNDAAVQANATAIGEVSTNLNTHATNTELHVTKDLQDRWNTAATDIEAFMKAEELGQGAIDTLTEIQQYIAKDASAADEMVKNIAKAQQTADDASTAAAAAQGTADQALALGQAAATKSEFNSYKTTNDAALAEVKATADAAAVKTSVDASLVLKADKTQVATDIAAAEGRAATDATTKANNAESNAKGYADAIKVNGVAQSNQEITVSGLNILVGGNGNHKDSSVNVAIEDLYSKVADASNAARVESLAVNSESSNYADVNAATGAVTLTIKKVALADASVSNTGVADAYDVKTSIATAKSEAISDVQGKEGDASTAATVAGAKAYADAQIEAAALRWTVLS